MGATLHVVGLKPASEKHAKMVAVVKTCRDAGISPPKEVKDYFGPRGYEWEFACAEGVEAFSVYPGSSEDPCGVQPLSGEMLCGFVIDLRQLDPDVKILKAYVSY